MNKRIAGNTPQTQPIMNATAITVGNSMIDSMINPTDNSITAPVAVLDQLGQLGQADSRDGTHPATAISPASRKNRTRPASAATRRYSAEYSADHASNRQAEVFYLQKQIQTQTQMVFVLEDDSQVQGIIEWYDRNSIKVRGRTRVLIYKSAIKYLYKAGELGSAPDA